MTSPQLPDLDLSDSQVSGLLIAGLTVLTLLFLTGLFEKLPNAVLAAVAIAAVIDLVDFGSLRRLWGIYTGPLGQIYRFAARVDFIAAVGAMLGVLIFDTLPGQFTGITLSLLTLLYRSSHPHVSALARQPHEAGLWVDQSRNPELEHDPRINVIRVEAGLFFANADFVRTRIVESLTSSTKAVILDGETTPFIDVTGASMLVQVRNDLQRRGVDLVLARDVGQVRDVVGKAEE